MGRRLATIGLRDERTRRCSPPVLIVSPLFRYRGLASCVKLSDRFDGCEMTFVGALT